MKKKKITSLFLASILAMSTLAGCGSSDSSNSSNNSASSSSDSTVSNDTSTNKVQEITFALQNQYDNIDPGITVNSFASPLLGNLFEGLVTYDQNNNLIPGCAESWEISEDSLTYTFKIRDGLKWSDGTPITSEDFLYSYTRVLTATTASQSTFNLTDFILNAEEFYNGSASNDDLGISAPDESTLVITLKNITPYFLDMLAMSVYSPVQATTVDANPDTWTLNADTYVSNGPFMMESLQFGEAITLVKNPNYHDADSVKLEKLTFRYILEPSTALSAYESGEIHGSNTVPPADMTRLRTDSNSGLQIVPSYGTSYYAVNCENEVLSDPLVRQALSLAIDRTSLIENVIQTTDIPASSLLPPGYSVDGIDFIDGRSDFNITDTANIELAQQLLAEAGYPNGEGFPTLRLGYYSDTVVKKVTEALQQMWKDNLNIDMNIEVSDWAVFYTELQADDFDIAALGNTGDFLHPLAFLQTQESKNHLNISNYNNPAFNEKYHEAAIMIDAVAAIDVMKEAEEILMYDMPIIPLYYRNKTFLMNPDITGYNFSPLNVPFFKHAEVK